MRPPEERELHQLWRDRKVKAVPLHAAPGGGLQIVFPGWANPGQGPDFKGALLRTPEGATLKGDVEIHVDSRGWCGHGHHRDPAYQNVVLHAVWKTNGAERTHTIHGREVAVAVLEPAKVRPRRPDARPCAGGEGQRDLDRLGRLLDCLGDRRFFEKAAALASCADQAGPDQAIYRGILGALGYSSNAQACAALADRVPLRTLAQRAQEAPPAERQAVVESLLFGAAGLLPSQRGLACIEDYPGELERRWSAAALGLEPPAPIWRFFQIRPENSPPRRIAAAAGLISAWERSGPLRWLLETEADLPPGSWVAALRQRLLVTHRTYWALHWDFGKESAWRPTLLGAERAADIVINVVLPFCYGWATQQGARRLAARCLEAYRLHPPLSENRVTRLMTRMLLPDDGRRVIHTARRQQGLIHLSKTRCASLLCAGCSLAHSWKRDQAPVGSRVQPLLAHVPPSTLSVMPVTHAARSEAR